MRICRCWVYHPRCTEKEISTQRLRKRDAAVGIARLQSSIPLCDTAHLFSTPRVVTIKRTEFPEIIARQARPLSSLLATTAPAFSAPWDPGRSNFPFPLVLRGS